MAEIVGIRFKKAGKIYNFDPAGIEMAPGDRVVVKTARGVEIGQVVTPPREAPENGPSEPLKEVVRIADAEDIARAEKQADKAAETLQECSALVTDLKLPMKLLEATYNMDGSRLTVMFSAEERVDFRELVKRLTNRFKVRVELRQVGSRDEAKLVGGYGRCGRSLCCMDFLSEFTPVSIKMAKEQELPLNPMKISGSCGRLMCCLAYENATYREMKAKMPRRGQHVTTPMGEATVSGTSVLKQTVFVHLAEGGSAEVPMADITRQD